MPTTEQDPLLLPQNKSNNNKNNNNNNNMLSLIAAGILMAPPMLVLVGTLPVVALLSIPGLALLCYRRPQQQQQIQQQGQSSSSSQQPPSEQQRRRAIVTGGSSGIGLCVAQECVERGFDEVIVIARNKQKLEQTKEQLQKIESKNKKKDVRIEALSVDIAKEEELQSAAETIFGKKTDNSNNDDNDNNTTTLLFCVAGITYPEYFDKLSATTFAKICHTNHLGSVYTVQAFLPFMSRGTILLTSSMAGQVGTFGYTAYSPTKFALRGLAEALHMELVKRPISVCVAYPPDTDTPCFAQENLTKPEETKLISEVAGLSQPLDVARTMVNQASQDNPPFAIYFTFDGWMLSALTCGFSPLTGILDGVSQIAGLGLFRIVSLFYLKAWHGIIRNYNNKRGDDNEKDGTEEDKKTK